MEVATRRRGTAPYSSFTVNMIYAGEQRRTQEVLVMRRVVHLLLGAGYGELADHCVSACKNIKRLKRPGEHVR